MQLGESLLILLFIELPFIAVAFISYVSTQFDKIVCGFRFRTKLGWVLRRRDLDRRFILEIADAGSERNHLPR